MRWMRLFLLMFVSKLVSGQNIVANGSFEDVNICEEFEASCSPAAWFFVAQKIAKGFYSMNEQPGTAGKNYISIDIARPNKPSRQYWETMLLCKLKAGETYVASMQLASSAAEAPDPADIHFFFTDGFILSMDDTLLQPAGYLSFSDAKVKRLKYNWIEVKKEFVADKDHQFLIIGNFSKAPNREILDRKKTNKTYSILIDDVSITPLKKNDCPEYEFIADSLYAISKRHIINSPVTDQPNTATAEIPQKVDTLVLNTILFDFDDYTIRNQDIFNKYKKQFNPDNIERILVVGYTDDAGTAAYNKQLSLKRSEEVGRVLSQKFGIPPSIITVEGRGVSTEYTDQYKNRRVQIYIYRK